MFGGGHGDAVVVSSIRQNCCKSSVFAPRFSSRAHGWTLVKEAVEDAISLCERKCVNVWKPVTYKRVSRGNIFNNAFNRPKNTRIAAPNIYARCALIIGKLVFGKCIVSSRMRAPWPWKLFHSPRRGSVPVRSRKASTTYHYCAKIFVKKKIPSLRRNTVRKVKLLLCRNAGTSMNIDRMHCSN